MTKATLSKFDPFKVVPPLLVLAASFLCIDTTREQKRRIQFVEQKTVELAQIATNFFAYASRINDLELSITNLPNSFGVLADESDDASGRLDRVGVIPYNYFRANGYKGISRGTIRLVIGQRSRYGVLTDCGRDFAEFDGRFVYGLGGES